MVFVQVVSNMGTLSSIIIASLIISLISLLGGIILFWKRLWTKNAGTHLVSFAAGVMLTASFVDLLPEALEEAGDNNIFMPVFFGIVVFFFLERFVLWFHHHDSHHGTKPAPILILLGDGVHNFIDGVAIAAAFLTNPSLGVVTTLAIAAHEIPQEIADFSVLVHGGLSKTKALLFNLVSALTALIGAIGGYYFLENLKGMVPLLLAFTAGMFIYIACSDLIPELHKDFQKQKSWVQSIPFIAGAFLLWLLVKLLEG